MKNVSVSVVSGDIAQVKADALITAINSGGAWFGGIDGVIMRAAGDLFHRWAASAVPLTDGETIVARSNGQVHRGAFTNVVFVVDDLKRSITEVIYAGLEAADKAGFASVTLPTIRMGVMLGVVEKSAEEAVVGMGVAIRNFLKRGPTSIKTITFVVYNDPKTQAMLQKALE